MFLFYLNGTNTECILLTERDYEKLLQLATCFGCIPRIEVRTSVIAYSDLLRLHKALWYGRIIIEKTPDLTLGHLAKHLEQTLQRRKGTVGYEELTTLKSIVRCYQIIQALRAENLEILNQFLKFLSAGRSHFVGYYYL